MGEEELGVLIQESLAVAMRAKPAKPADFAKVIVDTTVQPTAVAHPTDAKQLMLVRARSWSAGQKDARLAPIFCGRDTLSTTTLENRFQFGVNAMPSVDNSPMKIFISYASEDQRIADVLKLSLKAAFRDDIDITMMSEFATGLNWRGVIQQSISETDIMIVVATGRLKPSHSFTGAEVGAFGQSIYTQPKMTKWPTLPRRMIPFAVLARVPDTINEFEGINIDRTTLRDVRFDPTSLDDNLQRLQAEQQDTQPNSLKFFLDIQTLLDSRDVDSRRSSIADDRDRIAILSGFASDMTRQVISLILCREKDSQRPRAKLILRTGPGAAQLGESISIVDTTIELVGDFSKIFGPSVRANRRYNWGELVNNIDFDVSLQWQKALQKLITSREDNVYINDNSIISFDSKKLYRIFTSTVVIYYDDTVEYQVYAVEILHERDSGDPTTSLMLHAVDISLGYRFMFLENMSLFSPETFEATALADLKKRTSDMMDYLTVLLLKAEQYQLSDPQNILLILGTDSLQQIQQNYAIWNDAKTDLYTRVKAILRNDDLRSNDQLLLIKAIKEFRRLTIEMNKYYTNAVISKLQKILSEASTEFAVGQDKPLTS
jgi:hypothetical protein